MADLRVDINQDLKNYGQDAYDEMIENYIAYAAGNSRVLSIYQMGSIKDPGISDIDLVVVVDDVFDPVGMDQLRIHRFRQDERSQYLFAHDIYLYDCESFKKFYYTVHAGSLQHLYGTPLEIIEPEDEEKNILSLHNIFDFISSRLIQFYQFLASGRLSLRGTLMRVSSIRHSYALLKNLGVEDEEIRLFIDKVEEMRANPRDYDMNKILTIFTESFFYFSRLVWLASLCFRERYLASYNAVDMGNSLKLNSQFLMRFVENSARENHPLKTDPTIVYPETAYYHYLTYTEADSLISATARKVISSSCEEYYELDPLYRQTLHKRLCALSDHYIFLEKNRARFAMKGYPGFAV